MKRISFILIFIQLLTGCQNSTKIQTADYIGQINKIVDLVSKFENNKQVFNLSSKYKQAVVTQNGLKFLFDPSQLVSEDSTPLSDSITIEVIECLNQSDFIRTNIKTISNGKILVSGGAYKISMFTNGKKIKLKDNESMSVYLPRFSEDEMGLFYGQKDSIGQIQWIYTNKKLEKAGSLSRSIQSYQSDSVVSDKTLKKIDYYNPIKITSLDWINCDRFFDIKEKTNIFLNLETDQDSLVTMVYLIFKDINSVTTTQYIKLRKTIFNEGFNNLPLNSDVRIVAVSLTDNRIFAFSKDFKIQKDEVVNISLSQMTEQELNDLIDKK